MRKVRVVSLVNLVNLVPLVLLALMPLLPLHQCAPAVLQNINILMVIVLFVRIMNAVLVEEVEAFPSLTAQSALKISMDVFLVKLELNM